MLRLLGDAKVEYLSDGIISYYHCVNGVEHDSPCGYSCWLNNPNPELHLPKMGTEQAVEAYIRHFKLSDEVVADLKRLAGIKQESDVKKEGDKA